MNRRDFIRAGATAGAVFSTGVAMAAAEKPQKGKSQVDREARDQLISLASHCIEQAKRCQSHCIDLLSVGDDEMAECLRSVSEMLPACDMLLTHVSLNSDFLNDTGKLCAKVCSACEKVCREHAKSHGICKKCADSCKDLVAGLNSAGIA